MGPVRLFIAPNLQHDQYLIEPVKRYKLAELYAPHGFKKGHQDLPNHCELNDPSPKVWEEEIEQIQIKGVPYFNGVVFFHRTSRMIIIADLALHLREVSSFLLKIVFRFMGVTHKFSPSRIFKLLIKDRMAMRTSIDRLLGWDFDRIIVGHGKIIETEGKVALKEAYLWL